MEKIAVILNVQRVEVTVLFSMFLTIPLIYFFQQLPLRKGTEHYQQDKVKKQVFSGLLGLFFIWLIYSYVEVIGVLVFGLLFFYISKYSTTLQRYFVTNCLIFLILFFAHLHRYIFHGENPNYYGFGFILMILVPRVMYFNLFTFQQIQLRNNPGLKKDFKTYDID